ncbi:MAG: hypothetical protein KC442_23655 [Thermomicrobiales bacterium]|nr:hypothetical protein [Thermomicrobiales bacterium]
MRYLWISSVVMVVAGVACILGRFTGLLDPIAMILGAMLVWSGIVKLIVLRVWRTSLHRPGIQERRRAPGRSAS